MLKKQIVQYAPLDAKTPFSVAIVELEEISSLMQSGNIEIEDISKYYKRAVELKNFCLSRLQTIEIEIENIDGNTQQSSISIADDE